MKSVNLDELNKLLELTLTAPTSKLNAIISGMKLLLAAVFIIARHMLIKEEREKEAWEYRKKQLNSINQELEDLEDTNLF